MGLTKRRHTNAASHSSHLADSGQTQYGSASPPAQIASRIFAKDALLEAAEKGWGTTFRYAFLLVTKRVTAAGGIWLTAELAHHLRWFLWAPGPRQHRHLPRAPRCGYSALIELANGVHVE